MSTGMQTQQKWREFLDIYRENTCLWDVHSSLYMRRDLRNASYNVLLEKYREIDPDATLDMVKKKIDTFRTGYRREVKKMEECSLNSPPDFEYKPTLWYFDKMTFLDYQGDNSDVKDSYESDDQQGVEYIDIPDEYPEEDDPDPVVKYRLKSRNLDSMRRPRPSHKPYERKVQNSGSNQPSCSNEAEDDCATYCSNLKLQMRGLDTQQKFIAQKLISDVIFLARTSQLTLDSSILVNSDN
ncbi:uncharacterized protein LOC125230391 [Leguminivora glycinivorella]|uniref:uncharacterized protein LOC125230391 n=1 Tax=Leguminivora glycinivorella TaxID=1035111 RepID=UPI00200D8DBB|nr:uncharacterized protein LOC125230391 [Leguminivora glycinivorella]